MKKSLLSILVCSVLLLLVFCTGMAETQRNYPEEFNNMSLEELIDIYDSLGQIINEKKLGNAKLFVDPPEGRIAIEKSLKLTVSSDGRDVTEKTKITYESSDPSIATVSSGGTVKGVSAGDVTIRVSAVFEDEAVLETSAKITVYVPVSRIKVPESIIVFAGREFDLKEQISVAPENATDQRLVYTVDDDSIISVNENGIVTGIKGGKTFITVMSAEDTSEPKKAKIIVNVHQAVSEITLNQSEFTVGKEKTHKLEASVGPEDATDKSVTWSSEDTSIATVSSSGTVTGKTSGTTVITCTAKDGSGVSKSAKVTVITAVSSIKVSKKEVDMMEGETSKIDYSVSPKDATNQNITWSSSDSYVAKVSGTGMITAVKSGKCTITGTAQDGSGATISITLYVEPKVPVEVNSIHWQTQWGQKNGKMGVVGHSLCIHRRIKSFNYTVTCSSGFGQTVSSEMSYSGNTISPGKESRGKLSSKAVGGFANAWQIEITVTSVVFEDGTLYYIPSSDRYSTYFSP